ncbi:transcriptional regulator with XRE-family HTH domain [Desulfobaculum xiamenense]|uniref:Transcriptional regulator with XRE-family HTH domain n=1 Tax=Desulfobaculum xiamenense TaxID=995050 RepID=A0A846QGX0_9BACT|nr:S24 family peptidase [Desulfobaculum xiamenense]NJB67528.1 transcriptional regulator with XRE-family HTH domain [Desulfobaculum xiamenense]
METKTHVSDEGMRYFAEYPRIVELIIERIEALKDKGQSYAATAKLIGVKPPTITRWLKGDRSKLSLDIFLRCMDALQIQPHDVFSGITPDLQEYDFIPKVTAKLGCGSGSLQVESDVQGLYAFRSDFLEMWHFHKSRLVMFEATGDSMSPTIEDGDNILISTGTDMAPRTGELWAIGIDEELLIKRIERRPGVLVLKSDNLSYKPIEVPLNDHANIRLIGKALWLARIL